MRIFIQISDFSLWNTIVNGPHISIHTLNNLVILKLENDWDENDRRMAQLNAKAINALYYALTISEFNRISSYTSVKEILDRLDVTHEDKKLIKETKINMLVHKYEPFKMKPTEIITSMCTRFTDIVNNLKILGKVYTNGDLCRKILRLLLLNWDSKVTAIQEARDLSTLKVEELVGSLMTYEIGLNQHEEEELKKKKEKGIALKADVEGESDKDSEEVESDLSDLEVAFLARMFRSFMKKEKKNFRKKNINRKEIEKKIEKKMSMCYECNKLGYFRAECL